MSEVYIRSQNKEKLYRLGGNYACIEYGEYEDIKRKRGATTEEKKRHTICIYDDGLIEIWEYKGEQRSKCVCKVKEENDIDCYKRAIEALESYGKERERITYEKRAG